MAIKAGEVVTEYKSDLRGLESGARRAERVVDRSARNINRSLGAIGSGGAASAGSLSTLSQISNIIQAIPQIGNLAGALVTPLREAADEGLRLNMVIENATVGFSGAAGSLEAAARHVERMRRFGQDSPIFEFEGLLKTSSLMNVFGFQLDEHIPKIRAWGSAIATGGEVLSETLEGVARAFGQMATKGRVSAEEMEQLAERNVPAWELLAKAIGKSVAETRKLAEQGRLAGRPAVEAITAMIAEDPKYSKLPDMLAQTRSGRLGRLQEIRQESLQIATAGLAEETSLAVAGVLQQENLAHKMAEGVNTAITPLAGIIRAGVVTMTTDGFVGGFDEAFNAAKAVLPGKVTSLITEGVIGPMFKAAGVQSPSRHTIYIGEMMAEGLHVGLQNRLGKVAAESGKNIRQYLETLSKDPRIKAWFEMIRRVEGGGPDVMVGQGRVPSGAKHPGQVVPRSEWFRGPKGRSSAAGNWQITLSNWQKWAPQLGLNNFSDVDQQMMVALALFAEGGGPDALLGGNYGGALRASAPWAAVPGSHLPGRKPLSSQAFVSGYQKMLQGGAPGAAPTDSNPVPVRVVGDRSRWAASDPPEKWPSAGFDWEGFDRQMWGSDGPAAQLPAVGPRWQLQPTQPQVLGQSGEAFKSLVALGQISETIKEEFKEGESSAGQWAERVIQEAEKASSIVGITARDMREAFEGSFTYAFSSIEGGFRGMMGRFVTSFAESLNQMVQQWAASQLSSILGSVLKSIGGALSGGATLDSARLTSEAGFASFFGGGRYSGGPVEAGVMYETHGLGKREFFIPEKDGRIATQGQMAGGQTVVNNNYINVSLPRGADNMREPRSRRALAEQIARAVTPAFA